MNHRFEYRIGRHGWHSKQQWDATPGRTTSEIQRNLDKVEPAAWYFNVYAVIVNDKDEVVKISKHPCQVMGQDSLEAMQKEVILHSRAAELPVFNRDNFNVWNYFIINSDEISAEGIQATIDALDRGEE